MKGTIRNENTDVEIARIPLKGDYVLIASLSPEAPASGQGLQASTLNNIQAKSSISKVPNGVKYRVVVYDSEGGFVDQKIYTTGQNTSDDGQDFKLNGGSTYKFVVFHITMQRYHLLLQVQIPNHVIFQATRILCTIQKKWLSRDKQQIIWML